MWELTIHIGKYTVRIYVDAEKNEYHIISPFLTETFDILENGTTTINGKRFSKKKDKYFVNSKEMSINAFERRIYLQTIPDIVRKGVSLYGIALPTKEEYLRYPDGMTSCILYKRGDHLRLYAERRFLHLFRYSLSYNQNGSDVQYTDGISRRTKPFLDAIDYMICDGWIPVAYVVADNNAYNNAYRETIDRKFKRYAPTEIQGWRLRLRKWDNDYTRNIVTLYKLMGYCGKVIPLAEFPKK